MTLTDLSKNLKNHILPLKRLHVSCAIRYLLKKLNRFLHQLNSQNNCPVFLFSTINYLGIETVSCCLLQRIARMDMDWNLTKVLTLRRHKSLKKLLWFVFPGEICLISFSS